MKFDIANWFRGIVVIEIKGDFRERFLNLAFQENIRLNDIRTEGNRLYATIDLRQIHLLRGIARRSRCPFRICKRSGWPFIMAHIIKRPVLPLVAALAVFIFAFTASFIFTLDVGGPYPVSAEDQALVLELAADMGLAPGHSRWGMDMDKVKEYIQRNFTDLVFVEIAGSGVHVTIEVVKRVDVSQEDAVKSPGDMVAVCDGIIEDVLVRRGTAAVKAGDAVCKGDILIYGFSGQEGVAADGIVTARLWGEGYGECALKEEKEALSGNSAVSLGIRVNGGAYMHLAGAKDSPYKKFECREKVYNMLKWRKTNLTVEIISKEYGEVLTYTSEHSPLQAAVIARKAAQSNAYADLAADFGISADGNLQITEERTEDIDLGDGLARAHTVVGGLAEIGEYRKNDQYLQEIPEVILPDDGTESGI